MEYAKFMVGINAGKRLLIFLPLLGSYSVVMRYADTGMPPRLTLWRPFVVSFADFISCPFTVTGSTHSFVISHNRSYPQGPVTILDVWLYEGVPCVVDNPTRRVVKVI